MDEESQGLGALVLDKASDKAGKTDEEWWILKETTEFSGLQVPLPFLYP